MSGAATPSVLVVIVNFNGGAELRRCVRSVARQGVRATIAVVDNGSTDGSLEGLQELGQDVEVLRYPDNPGFGFAVNAAAAHFPSDLLAVLNPDIELAPGCLAMLMRSCLDPMSVVGPELDVAASERREVGATINHLGMPTALPAGRRPLYLPGCALVMPRCLFEAVGGFDDRYFLFVEDVELCWRALLGDFDVRVVPGATAAHIGGGSTHGGYLRSGSAYETSDLRVAFRERNTIALMVACAPLHWLPLVLPLLVARTVAVAAGAAALGRRSLAKRLVSGLAWNLRQAPLSLRRRRSMSRSPEGSRIATRRVIAAPLLIRVLLDHGLPQIK